MKDRKNSWIKPGWYLAIFAFLYVWFSRVHPLVVYDVDDWTYLAYVREAMPLWGDWNPGKVFPEFLMPALSSLAYYCLYPIIGDYITTFTVFHAFVVSGFITVYIWCFGEMLERVFSLDSVPAMLLSGFFLMFHFMVLRGREVNNMYLFHCVDLNCYYNYLMPSILNASLVMFLTANNSFRGFMEQGRPVWKGLFWLVIYFAIFSNLAVTGILVCFIGSRLLLALLRRIRKFRLKEYIQENQIDLTILVIWLVSAVFELSGGRAEESGLGSGLLEKVHMSAFGLKEVLYGSNRVFWLLVAVILVAAGLTFLRNRGKGESEEKLLKGVLVFSIAGAVTLIYTLLMCAVVWWEYILRGEYLLGLFFYGFVLVLFAAAYLLKKYPKLEMVLPLLLVVLCSTVNTNGPTFQESNKHNVNASICADISRDILDQIVSASESGEREMVLQVPYHVADPVNQDNWPHTLNLMYRISDALYEHGIIKQKLYIVDVQPNLEMNQKYGLAIPD